MSSPPRFTLAQLLSRHCEHLVQKDALHADALASQLPILPRWSVVDGALQAEYTFVDWWNTLAFVNALAYVVHREDHHPDLQVSFSRCTVRWSTHSAGGITVNDLICAAQTDRLYDSRPGAH